MEFTFDKQLQRYRYKDSGKFLSQEAAKNLTQKSIDTLEPAIQTISDRLIQREISLEQWETETRNTLRQLHTWQYTLGVGGQNNFTASDRGTLNNILKKEWKYLREFATEVNRGTLSEAQIKARVQLYLNNTNKSYERGRYQAHQRANYKWERRIRTKTESCNPCIEYAAAGWQPIGTLPNPGLRCDCTANCGCYKEFSLSTDKPDASSFLSRSWGWLGFAARDDPPNSFK
jgi:hypothetical protein